MGLAISRAYLEFGYDKAKQELSLIVHNLGNRYPKATNSLLEGLEETLTVHRLKLPTLPRQALCTTNALESANSICAASIKRITNWQKGEMILRNVAAGFLKAENCFRRIRGYRQIPVLSDSLSSFLRLNSQKNLIHSA